MPNLKEEILKEFDKNFDLDNYGESHIVQNKVKQFISSALDKQHKADMEEVRKELDKIIELQKQVPIVVYGMDKKSYEQGWKDGLTNFQSGLHQTEKINNRFNTLKEKV